MKHEAQARDWRYVATVADPDEDWTYIDRTPGARITIQDRDASYVEIGTDDAGLWHIELANDEGLRRLLAAMDDYGLPQGD